jgi:TolB-like protein/Tfp pilus assembly protein PilF
VTTPTTPNTSRPCRSGIGEINEDSPPLRELAEPGTPPVVTSPNRIGRRALVAGLTGSVAVGTALVGWRWWARRKIDSIAVLPLENLSGDPAQEFLADGMTDELIGELARIRSLRVISRTSVMRYKGQAKKPLQQIARELQVDAIVEGSVALAGGRVRITAQLIRAADDRHIWSERYERKLADVLRLQNDVARAIAVQVRGQLVADSRRLRRVSPEAHEAYLKAYASVYLGPMGIPRSLELFRRTLELDPEDANAHAALAEALCYAGIFSWRPTEETYPEARKLAMRALELDESNASARNVLADVKKGYDWDLVGAEAEYRRALQLNPSHLLTRLWFAEMWSRLGRFNEAIEESLRAGALDPVSPGVPTNRATLYWRAARFEDAIASAQRALDIAPGQVNALWWQGLAHAGKRDFAKALQSLRRAEALNPGPMTLGYLGHTLALAGQRAQAQEILTRLRAMSETRYVGPVDYAAVHAGLGDWEAAFKWLETAFQRRNHGVHVLRCPLFDGLRDDPRYANFLRRTGVA